MRDEEKEKKRRPRAAGGVGAVGGALHGDWPPPSKGCGHGKPDGSDALSARRGRPLPLTYGVRAWYGLDRWEPMPPSREATGYGEIGGRAFLL